MHILNISKKQRLTTLIISSVLLIFMCALAAILTQRSAPTASAAPALSFALYTTHPYASQSGFELGKGSCTEAFCPAGRDIHDIAITDDGQLIAGYGDWNRNSDSHGVPEGRVGVVPLNLADATWGTMFYAGTESIDNIRKINGHLYIPTTDPSIKLATGNSTYNVSGYITNDTGSWRYVNLGSPTNEHVFDIATLNGTDLWAVGSGQDKANARRSTDGGATWQYMRQTSPGGGFDRHYWAATLNGKIYMRNSEGSPVAVSYNGTSWQDEPGLTCGAYSQGYGYYASRVEVFDNHIVCTSNTSHHIQTFNGTTTQQTQFTQTNGQMRDMYIHDGYLYILHTQGISRTNSLSGTWEDLSVALPPAPRSIAVYDDDIYIGGTEGSIYKSTTELQEAEPLSTPDDSCFTFNTTTKTITGYSNDTVACPRAIIIPSTIGPDEVPVENIGAGAFYDKGLAAVILPDSVVTIGPGALNGNYLQSVIIPDSVTTIGDAAFLGNQLTTLTIGNSVETIGNYAFYDNQLTTVTIPDSVQTIGSDIFSNNPLQSVTIGAPDYEGPATLEIPSSLFNSQGITSLTLGPVVASIGSYAFLDNQLTALTIPNSVHTIGSYAFSGNQLTTLTIGNSVQTIGDAAFLGNQLTTLTIGNSVQTIGDAAFDNNQLTTVTISGNPTLGAGVFNYNGLDKSTVPSGLTTAQLYEYSQNNAHMVHIYAANPDFVAANQDTLYTDCAGPWMGGGVYAPPCFAISGYLINPASVTITYRSKGGSDLTTQQTLIGSDPSLQTYQLANFLDLSDPDNPVLDQAKLDTLYRIGDTITITPPEIDGYITPQPFTITLTSGEMTHNVVYTSYEEQAALDREAERQNSANNLLGRLAESGASLWAAVASGIVLVGGAVIIGKRRA